MLSASRRRVFFVRRLRVFGRVSGIMSTGGVGGGSAYDVCSTKTSRVESCVVSCGSWCGEYAGGGVDAGGDGLEGCEDGGGAAS
jgi:hypothetical protein